MQFIDLAEQQRHIRDKIDQRIRGVLDHGKYIMGPEVIELEQKLCEFTGAQFCISCSSGTDALLMPLVAWQIGPQDAVFVPPFTFFATAETPAFLGATPIFVDVDPVTHNMRPDLLEKAILAVLQRDNSIYPLPKVAQESQLTPKVVIPVDLFGQAASYEAILPIAHKYGLRVLEDAAQAFGAERHHRKTCALGCDAAATSFFPAKPLGCYGDGGAIFTDNAELAEILRSIRVHGKGHDKYDNVRLGINGRLDTLQAAILLAKLDVFPQEIIARQHVAKCYAACLADVPEVISPEIEEGAVSVWAQYCIQLPENKRQPVMSSLQEQKIPSNIYYPKPQHQLAVFTNLGYTPDDFPQAKATSARILALPFHPYMKEEDVAKVVNALRKALV